MSSANVSNENQAAKVNKAIDAGLLWGAERYRVLEDVRNMLGEAAFVPSGKEDAVERMRWRGRGGEEAAERMRRGGRLS